MRLSSQIAAIGVLLVSIVLVFILVGAGGVSTAPDPTRTPVLTAEATPLPPEEAAALAWTESGPNRYTHTTVPEAFIQVNPFTIAEFAANWEVEAPAEDASFPLLDVLGKVRTRMETEFGPGGEYDGPAMELIEGVPVALLHLQYAPEVSPAFPDGLEAVVAAVDRGEGNLNQVLYVLQRQADPDVYADFRVWLQANVDDLGPAAEPAATEEAAATEEVGETATQEAAPTEEAAPASTEEAAPATEEAAAPTEEPGEVTATQEALATEEPAPATEEAPAPTEEAAAPAATEEAEVQVPADFTGEPWSPVGYGYTYVPDPAARFEYEITTQEQYSQTNQLQPPADDSESPSLDLITQLHEQLAGSLDQMQLPQPAEIEGPEVREIGGVDVALSHFRIAAQNFSDGSPFPGDERFYGLIERSDGMVVSLQYARRGDLSPAGYEAFLAWLEANAAALATPDAEIEPADPTLWTENSGQLRYNPLPDADIQIVYNVMPVTDFAAQFGLQPPAEDVETPIMNLLTQMRDQVQAFGGEGMEMGEPTLEDMNGVPVALLRFSRAEQQAADGSTIEGFEAVLGLIDRGDGTVAVISHAGAGTLDPAVYEHFLGWLEANAERLATPAPTSVTPEASATQEPTPAATEAVE